MTKRLRPFAIILAVAAASAAGAFANGDSQPLSTEAITGAAMRAIALMQSSQGV